MKLSMKLAELKKEIQKYQYFEDTDIIDVTLASVIAGRMKIGDPIWLILIGPSSSGKSQILRPVSLTDTTFIHRVDDLTENTFLSAMAGDDKSLLNRIGTHGIIVISDLTVLFSKANESRSTILSQFRMIYDGKMTKFSGNKDEPIEWEGYLNIIAGSTPSIYAGFEEVADMGERFIYYRMKPFDAKRATEVSMKRGLFGHELDRKLAEMYAEYIKEAVQGSRDDLDKIVLSDEINERILRIAMFAEKVRTTQHTDWRGTINRIPVPAMPMRVALQLTAMAKALAVIRFHETGSYDLGEADARIIEWCGYSLANEEKRTVLKILASMEFGRELNTSTMADRVGLDTHIVSVTLQNLAAVGVLTRSADGKLNWKITSESDYNLIRLVEGLCETEEIENRDTTSEEEDEQDKQAEAEFEKFEF